MQARHRRETMKNMEDRLEDIEELFDKADAGG